MEKKSKLMKRVWAFVPMVIILMGTPSFGATIDVYLQAGVTTIPVNTFNNAEDITMWGYALCNADFSACNPPTVPGPTLTATVGDTLNIHVRNNLPAPAPGVFTEPTSVIIPGQVPVVGQSTPTWTDGTTGPRASADQRVRSFATETPVAGTVVYSWANLKTGTYLYQSGTHPAIQVQMGLYGPLIVYQGPSQAYNGVSFNKEVALLFSEIDLELHYSVASGHYGLPQTIGPGGPIRGRRTSATDYVPRFFLIAPRGTDIPVGLSGQTFSPKLGPVVTVNPGQTILLRFLNAGLLEKTPTLQNQYMTVVAEDGNLLPYSKQQYSSLLPAGKTMDAILAPTAAGYIPLFDRSLNLTNTGVSPGGQMRYIWVASAEQTSLAANKLPNGPFNTGTGTVMTTSLPGGFDCGSACQTLSVSYNTGTMLSLGAPADFGSQFTGWSGACTGTADCILTLATPQSVTATFVPIWVSVPGATPSAPAIAWDSTHSKFHMAARGMDNRIYVGTADPYGALNNDWRALPGGFTPDAPAIAWDVTAQKLYVVARGMDNAIYGVSVNATGAVSPWTKFSSGLTDAAPAIALNGADLYVVVRGMDNKIYGVTVNPATWALSGSWTQAPGATPDAPAIASGGSNLYVVVRGMDNKIYGVTVNPATWTFGVPWTVEPGATSSAPAIVWNPNGSLHVVVRGTNNGVYAATVNPADWSLSVPWTPLSGGSTPTAPAIGLSPPTGRVNILITGMDNSLWEWASTFLY